MVGFADAKRGENYHREHKKRNNMKKYIYGIMAMILGAVAFIACEDDIDEVAMWNRVVDNSSEIAGLKSACDKINYNVSSFTKIVEAQNKNLFISAAYPNEDGYLIVFSDGSFAQLLNGKDGADGKDGVDGKDGINGINGVDGKDGKDGYVPAIAIKKDADGIYYWTCDGAFMLDETGSKVPAQGKDGVDGKNGANGLVAQFTVSEAGELLYRYSDTKAWSSLGNVKGADGANGTNGTNGTNGADGKTPTFKIVEGNLLVSYDGVNWKDLGNVKGADGANGADGTDGINGTNGKNGKDGITPEFMIQDGKWFVTYNNKYTWVELGQATGDKGADGKDGINGTNGKDGVDGKDGINGTNGKDGVDGKDGINGTNGKDGVDGKDGITPKLKIVDGYWYISYDGGKTYETEPLGKATGDNGADGKDGVNGTNGTNGKDGVDGKTPTFKVESGNLYVSYNSGTSWTNLGSVKGANGTNGVDGKTPIIKVEDGKWYVSYDNGKTWTEIEGSSVIGGGNNTSLPSNGNIDGYEYVDLGLPSGIKWATMNVGASKPEDYGDYYAWGEIAPAQNNYSIKNCNAYDKSSVELNASGVLDANGNLTAYCDAATQNWSENWRMPTKEDFEELINNCKWTWITLGGVDGFKVASKKEGNSNWIFLPAVAYKEDNHNYATGFTGYYWSSTVDNRGDVTAYALNFLHTGPKSVDDKSRYEGYTIRPVVNKKPQVTSSISLSKTSVSIYPGESFDLTVKDNNGNVIPPSNITWSISVSSVLSYATNGGATQFTSETTVATNLKLVAKYNDLTASCDVSIKKKTIDNGVLNGYEYVDLGLPSGLKWATMNVGASSPEDYGTYFAWGEIAPAPNNYYSKANCKAYNKSKSSLQTSGVLDANGNLTADYDAATQNWSENWRMPTKADFDELIANCTWSWTEIVGGCYGCKVASKKAGNTNWIFLPAAGYRSGTYLDFVYSIGAYWSSTVDGSDSGNAYYLDFGPSINSMHSDGRVYGCPVRPVCE